MRICTHHRLLVWMCFVACNVRLINALRSNKPTQSIKCYNRTTRRKFTQPFIRRKRKLSMTSTATATSTSTSSSNGDHLDGLPRPLILGSASFTRKQILKEMKIEYHVLVRPIDEKQVGNRTLETPEQLTNNIAQAKMNHLVKEIMAGNCDMDLPKHEKDQEWFIMTADQVVTCQGKILEKPDNEAQAKDFVTQYGQHPCTTVGCVVLTHLPSQTTISGK
jgi:predicted house-cleaning NTP pyrophosphatase (Maf/HAM1 superfamily)